MRMFLGRYLSLPLFRRCGIVLGQDVETHLAGARVAHGLQISLHLVFGILHCDPGRNEPP